VHTLTTSAANEADVEQVSDLLHGKEDAVWADSGYTLAVRTDNGPEFTSRAFMGWPQTHGIRHILIEPGRPCRTATSRASTESSGRSA